jgi:hypothetical protein
VGGLSGIAYDPGRDLYYALADGGLKDQPARFYTLTAALGLGTFTDPVISGVTVLRDARGEPFTGDNFDGEGIAVASGGDELLVASETEPSIRRFSLDGRLLAEVPVPRKFLVAPEGRASDNATFESLALDPDGRVLFTANELPLAADGQSGSSGEDDRRGRHREGNPVRLLRYELRYENGGPSGFGPAREYFYLAGPGQSVSEIAAPSGSELLVLERDKRQIFRVSLGEAEDVSGEASLAASGAAPLEKELLVDVDDHCPLPGGEEKGSLGLLEAMTLGPVLPGGRRALLLQTDDGFRGDERALTIALGIPDHGDGGAAGR